MTTAVKPPRQRRRHGLGKDGVEALLDAQGRACAICGVAYKDEPGHRLAMDHNHKHCPGAIGCAVCVRGMLCNRCNNLVRLSGESIPILLKTIGYLRDHGAKGSSHYIGGKP